MNMQSWNYLCISIPTYVHMTVPYCTYLYNVCGICTVHIYSVCMCICTVLYIRMYIQCMYVYVL